MLAELKAVLVLLFCAGGVMLLSYAFMLPLVPMLIQYRLGCSA